MAQGRNVAFETTQVWQSVHTEQSTGEMAQTTVDLSEDIGLLRVRNDPF